MVEGFDVPECFHDGDSSVGDGVEVYFFSVNGKGGHEPGVHEVGCDDCSEDVFVDVSVSYMVAFKLVFDECEQFGVVKVGEDGCVEGDGCFSGGDEVEVVFFAELDVFFSDDAFGFKAR